MDWKSSVANELCFIFNNQWTQKCKLLRPQKLTERQINMSILWLTILRLTIHIIGNKYRKPSDAHLVCNVLRRRYRTRWRLHEGDPAWTVFVLGRGGGSLWPGRGCRSTGWWNWPTLIVTFPIVGKVFSINSQTFSNKTFLSKRFLVSGLHFLQDQAKWLCSSEMVWFGSKKSFGFFQTWSRV